ncbi:hypothetical protein HUJ05_007383 [Dendroctonus ponderosae]|nr:hypothetical protein HUJ05_007383 [Dendroctonus ponderosae]
MNTVQTLGTGGHNSTKKIRRDEVNTGHIWNFTSSIERKPLCPDELDEEAPYLQYATWSHDGSAIAFVYNNDIYYKPKVEKSLVCRITNNGHPQRMFNGVPDWLYETEILKTSHAMWFSPDNYYLLYLSFNNSRVGEYSYAWYNSKNLDAIYPEVRSFRYPRVETANPIVKAWIVNLTTPKYLFPFELKPTNRVEPDSYITSIQFHGENNVNVIWLNRAHNIFVIATCSNQQAYNCSEFHVEKEHEHIGWTEPVFHPVFNENGSKALVRLPVKDGDNGHYMHVCEIYKGRVRPLTHGAFEIVQVLVWDEDNSFIYAIGTIEQNPGSRHLIKITDKNSLPLWECVTCVSDMDWNSTEPFCYNETVLNDNLWLNYRCEYNNVVFSNNSSYFIQECLGPEIPIVTLARTSSYERLAILDSSSRLRRRMKRFSKPQMKHITVEMEFGYKAQVRMYLPAILREYEDTTFPLVLLV